MLECIKIVLAEYQNEFVLALLPRHDFRIDLEDNMPPNHRPLYFLSLLELEEAQKQVRCILEHAVFCPSDSPYTRALRCCLLSWKGVH